MQRTIFSPRLAMLICALMAIMMLGSTAADGAGTPVYACATGTYTVDLTAMAGQPCFPFGIKTSWGGGAVVWPPTGPYAGPNVYVENTPVLPGTQLDYIAISGVPTTFPGIIGEFQANTPCGPICYRTCLDGNGCLVIKVYPGPCPPLPYLPCP